MNPFDYFPPCEVCGKAPESDCDCPECPVCATVGDPKCYDLGHLKMPEDSVAAFMNYIGIRPIGECLKAIDKHHVEHVWLILRQPHPKTGETRIYYHSKVALDFLPDWTRLAGLGLGGIAWDGTDWEWSEEGPVSWDWLDEAQERFHEALDEHDMLNPEGDD